MSLDDTFNMEKERLIDGELCPDIPEDPEDQNLDLVIQLALRAYGSLMETASFMEPKDRVKLYEVAERYLNQAKDARFKKEKLQADALKAQGKKVSKSEGETEGEEQKKEGVSRKELNEKLKQVK